MFKMIKWLIRKDIEHAANGGYNSWKSVVMIYVVLFLIGMMLDLAFGQSYYPDYNPPSIPDAPMHVWEHEPNTDEHYFQQQKLKQYNEEMIEYQRKKRQYDKNYQFELQQMYNSDRFFDGIDGRD